MNLRWSFLLLAGGLAAQTIPQGFLDEAIANVGGPTSLAWTPDGRLLITTQNGTVRIFQNDALLPAPALAIPASRLCSNSERGLLGIAVDPAFSSNGFLYLYYTFRKPAPGDCSANTANSPVNRVSRFVLSPGNTIDPSSETILIDNIPSPNGNHNAGDLQFGKDGHLYVSTGDGGCSYSDRTRCASTNDAAREQHTLLGKVLRIAKDGGIPGDNPFTGAGTARCNTGSAAPGVKCQEQFVWGLRNPFRIAMDPNAPGTRFFINDVGQNTWEEIDEAHAGRDYGWNVREGPCANGSTTSCNPLLPYEDPVFAYRRDIAVPGTSVRGCASISGGAFVPNGVWPPQFDGTYLFSDYVCGAVFVLAPANPAARELLTGLGQSSAVHLAFGPHRDTRALYYTTYAGGGRVRRLSYAIAGSNNAPAAVLAATPPGGPIPLRVAFSAAGSSDPDPGDTLSYFWDFGDGATLTTASPSAEHTYTTRGTFTATLRVRDQAFAFSRAASVRIFAGNNAPEVRIVSGPSQFRVGEAITLTGSAADAEDGAVPAASLRWTVTLHHAEHTHPFVQATPGGSLTFTTPAPEDLAAAGNSFLEVRLEAVDAAGQTGSASRRLDPVKVSLTFDSQPRGARFLINGAEVIAPAAVVSWEGYLLNVSPAGGAGLVFQDWTDGAPMNRTIRTPAAPATYTARFQPAATGAGIVTPATNVPGSIAPGSIATLYGSTGAPAVVAPPGALPSTLGGVSLTIRDSANVERAAPLYFVGPGQINFVVPAAAAPGTASLSLTGANLRAEAIIERTSPSLFSADMRGSGPAAAFAVSTGVSGQRIQYAFACEPQCITLPIEVTADSVLVLFGTGIRNADPGTVQVLAGGVSIPVLFAGAQPEYAGLDQVNAAIPLALAGRGETDVTIVAAGKSSNVLRIRLR